MKPLRWTHHATQSLNERRLSRIIAEQTIAQPEFSVPDPPDRKIFMRRYFDETSQQAMLMRVVVAETEQEIVVVTLYKTSQIDRYLKGLIP